MTISFKTREIYLIKQFYTDDASKSQLKQVNFIFTKVIVKIIIVIWICGGEWAKSIESESRDLSSFQKENVCYSQCLNGY